MNFDLPTEMDCYMQVWFAALVQAVEDAVLEVGKPKIHRHGQYCRKNCRRKAYTEQHYYKRVALDWFRHERTDVGSFKWICSTLSIQPEKILGQINQTIKLRRAKKAAAAVSARGSIVG